VIHSEAYKDTSLQMERESLKIRKTQIRSSAVQGLLFGSSSSAMFRLIGHGVVSEKHVAAIGHGIVSGKNSAAAGSRRRHLISSAK
jgi:hypothetical protein